MSGGQTEEVKISKEVGAELLRLALTQAQSGWAAADALDRKLVAVFSQSVTLALASMGAAIATFSAPGVPLHFSFGLFAGGVVFVVSGIVALRGMAVTRVKPYGARPGAALNEHVAEAEPGYAMLLLAWMQSDIWLENEKAFAPMARCAALAQRLFVSAVPAGIAVAAWAGLVALATGP